LLAQYPNGGWPQFYPLRTDYSRHITFNDGAMAGVLTVLDDVAKATTPFGFIDTGRRARAADAVSRGIDVILRSQVRVNDRLTAWCAQHDEVTLAPRPARSYEHASLSGAETVGIVRFLMRDPKPDSRIVYAVEAAVAWLRRVQLEADPPRWARFYEIGTDRPIFLGRVVRYRLDDIEAERRDGYAWTGAWPRPLLEKEYPAWQRRIAGSRVRDLASLLRIQFVHAPDLTEGSPHFLYHFHVFECRLQRFGGCVHGTHRRGPGSLGRDSCLLTGGARHLRDFPQVLPLYSDRLEGLSMLVADFPRFLCQAPEPFRLIPGGFG
jgi:hypothetical protein